MPRKTRRTRRDFVAKSAAASFGFTMLPSYLVTGVRAQDGKLPPSKRINLAVIGVGGRGSRVVPAICSGGKAQPVAFCDVDFKAPRVDSNLKKFPGVPQFADFRKMLEKMEGDIDAVSVATPDHTHFPATMLAMSMKKHVFVEKPLTHSYREAELLMRAEKKFGVVTQMGNQGHTSGGSVQFEKMLREGVVRDITKIDAWKGPGLFFMDPKKRISKFPKAEAMPASLDWDLWCGPAKKREFCSLLHPFSWRGFWEYGNGMFGDWGAHIIDFVHEFLELGQPTKLTPHRIDERNDVIFPLRSHLTMSFPQRGRHPAVDLTWRDGPGCMPKVPEQFYERNKKGELASPRLGGAGTLLYRDGGDFAVARGSHSGRSRIVLKERAPEFAESMRVANPKRNHIQSFTAACMGEDRTRSPFSVGGDLTKTLMLGIICQRLGEELFFDRETERFLGNDRANALLDGPAPGKGWEDYYRMA